ncbi:MAG TPA: hypothetical protein VGY13_04960 [Solirubrobacteraceae bacterium]|nr:hypothetical protein [Solirubrobacteraceae bacterium]
MTTFARSFLPGHTSIRRGYAPLLAVLAALLALPAGASAVVAEVEGTKVGLQPRDVSSFDDGTTAGEFRDAAGGPIVSTNQTYVIYWEPSGTYYNVWQTDINDFLAGMGNSSGSLDSVYAVDTQYTDPANQHALYQSAAHGAYTDMNPYPTSGNCTDPSPLHAGKALTCLTDKQIREQLETFISEQKLPKGLGAIYYVLTPPGVAVCLSAGRCSDYPGNPERIERDEAEKTEPLEYKLYKNSFCSYHSDINPDDAVDGDGSTVLYAVVPWIAGGAGDYHLAGEDQKQAYECQDGGFFFNPETFSIEKEAPKVSPKQEAEKRLAAEKAENEQLTSYEEQFKKELITEAELKAKRAELKKAQEERESKEKAEREKREATEDPHEQEPNQNGRGEDSFYEDGLSDLIVSQIGVEQQNVVTDPLLNGWQDGAGNESTDECRNFFALPSGGSVPALEFTEAGTLSNQTLGGVNAYVNDAYNLAAAKNEYPGVPCLTGVNLDPEFNLPNAVKAGETVGFDGMESRITLNQGVKFSASGKEEPNYPTFTWNFGDGSPEVSGYAPGAPDANSPAATPCPAPWLSPCAASTFHSYQYGGTYEVTLKVTDVGGNTASVTRTITVEGPPRPGSGGSGSGSGTGSSSGSGSGSSAGSGSGSTGTHPAGVAAPVAAAAVLPQSLRGALRRGLVVSYSVNEQVAGHFEVLLSKSLAHRMGISGTPATGLAAGTPPELVIAKAILVTTAGGRSAVHIQFPKRTAKRLAHAHRLTLMLRLIVHNASTTNPATTSVLTSFTLG